MEFLSDIGKRYENLPIAESDNFTIQCGFLCAQGVWRGERHDSDQLKIAQAIDNYKKLVSYQLISIDLSNYSVKYRTQLGLTRLFEQLFWNDDTTMENCFNTLLTIAYGLGEIH